MYLMMHGAEEFLSEEVDSLALQKLMEHDRQMGTQYYKTLECYVKCRYNAAHTAKELFIHRSTFLNRLERIKELTKLDLDDFASRLYVELSVYRREEKKVSGSLIFFCFLFEQTKREIQVKNLVGVV